jgi:ribonuclease P protein subunit POP4
MKIIPKSTNDWGFTIKGKNMIVKGSTITKRPFERIGAKA